MVTEVTHAATLSDMDTRTFETLDVDGSRYTSLPSLRWAVGFAYLNLIADGYDAERDPSAIGPNRAARAAVLEMVDAGTWRLCPKSVAQWVYDRAREEAAAAGVPLEGCVAPYRRPYPTQAAPDEGRD